MSVLAELALPIFQAPVGSAASIEMAAAVSNAGACGSLAMTWTEPAAAGAAVRKLRGMTDGLFAANFVLSFAPKSLDAVLAAKVPIVTFSWGISEEYVARAKLAGAMAGVQVGSIAGARRAIRAGADFLICQGREAGGHVQSTTRISDLIDGVNRLGAGIPAIAAGGLADGDDVAECIERGADGAMLGTRFVATHESQAHADYKTAIVEAQENDTSFTWCFDGGWPYSGHRVIRNATIENWEAAGCPPPGRRPGENEPVGLSRSSGWLPRYHMASPTDATSGAVKEMALYAGTGSARIHNLMSVSDVVAELARNLGSATIGGDRKG